MPKLKIPDRYLGGVEKVGRLNSDDVCTIRDSLDKSPVGNTPLNIASLVEAAAPLEKRADFREIGTALGSLYIVRSSGDVPVDEFVDDVWEAFESAQANAIYQAAPIDPLRFKGNLIALMSAELFTVVSKAIDLATDDERIFCHVRVLTDMRPVFSANIEAGPAGMVIVHLMKIAFHDATSKDHKEFYVSLDADDLQILKKTVERAEAKAKSLQSKFKDIQFFQTQARESRT